MKRKMNGERGMSLVEVTIILMVLALVTAVIAPSIGDYVNDAKQTKAKEDVEVIGLGIARLVRDTGIPCLTTDGTSTCTKAKRVDLLLSIDEDTAIPGVDTGLTYAPPAGASLDATVGWRGGGSATNMGYMDPHLASNSVGYTGLAATGFSAGGGPRSGLGWRGAYLTAPIARDPWGYMYQANTIFLAAASDATVGNTEGLSGWSKDVIVISAGANGRIQTGFAGTANGGSLPVGDDVVYVVSGSSR